MSKDGSMEVMYATMLTGNRPLCSQQIERVLSNKKYTSNEIKLLSIENVLNTMFFIVLFMILIVAFSACNVHIRPSTFCL